MGMNPVELGSFSWQMNPVGSVDVMRGWEPAVETTEVACHSRGPRFDIMFSMKNMAIFLGSTPVSDGLR